MPIDDVAQRDRVMKRSVERAPHGVDTVDAVHGWPGVFRRGQPHRDVNAANDEDALIGFHLAGYVCREPATARIDLTRLQRASKGSEHSTRGCGDHVIPIGSPQSTGDTMP